MLQLFVTIRPKNLHTSHNLFLMNLDISDILFVCIGLPVVAYCYAVETWQFGEAICRLHNYCLQVTVCISSYTMAAVALFRCRTITGSASLRQASRKPSNDCSTKVHKTTICCIAIIWLIILTVNLPVLYLYG